MPTKKMNKNGKLRIGPLYVSPDTVLKLETYVFKQKQLGVKTTRSGTMEAALDTFLKDVKPLRTT